MHFTANLQGYLIFMCRFAPYVKNGTNCYGTITYIGKRTKTKKVWICYFMSWLDIPRFQKTTDTIWRSNNLWSKYKCLYASRWIKYAAFIVKTDCIKKFGGISQKNTKTKQWFICIYKCLWSFHAKKVQITVEVKNLAYSRNVTKTNLWWFVEYKLSSILCLQNCLNKF